MWKEINRYKIVDGDGNTEEMILERNNNGTFRIRNDFGNLNIELDTMSAIEYLRKMLDDIRDQIDYDINDVWDDLTDEDTDCDGDSDG